uniref:Uncharacterized protein n=1 Tax=Glossina palpalis gambiensis TaxID=67801 RepID=A0A1B0BET9_9MUSC
MNVYNTFNGTLCRVEIHEHIHEDLHKRNRFQFPTNAEIRDNKLRSRAEQHAANTEVNGCYWAATVNYCMSISWLVSTKLWPQSAFMNAFAVFAMKVYYEVPILWVTNSLLSKVDTYDGHIRLFNETEKDLLAEGTTNAALKRFYTKSLKNKFIAKTNRNVFTRKERPTTSKFTYYWESHESTERHRKMYLNSRCFRPCNR